MINYPWWSGADIEVDWGKTGGRRWVTIARPTQFDQRDRPHRPDGPSGENTDEETITYGHQRGDGSDEAGGGRNGAYDPVGDDRPCASARNHSERDDRDGGDGVAGDFLGDDHPEPEEIL